MAQFTIRIPDEMRDSIKAAAEADKRSMNAQIEWLLGSALADRAPSATRAERDRIIRLADSYQCPCGEDCNAADAVRSFADQISAEGS